jgi:hypothetical protein
MVYVFTATDELCNDPFPFRFMTGLWLVAPCSLPTTLPSSLSLCTESPLAHVTATFVTLSAPERCSRNRWLARVIATFVSSRLVSNRIGSSSPQSLYVSFFSLATKYVWNTSAPPSFLPAPSVLFGQILVISGGGLRLAKNSSSAYYEGLVLTVAYGPSAGYGPRSCWKSLFPVVLQRGLPVMVCAHPNCDSGQLCRLWAAADAKLLWPHLPGDFVRVPN